MQGASSKSSRTRAVLTAYPRAIPAILFLAVAAITALCVYAIESNERQRQHAEAEQFAQSIATALDRRGNGFSSYLRAGAALFSIDEVGPETFAQFVAELRVDQNYRGAEGIGWSTAIAPGEVEPFLENVRREQPDFPAIRPAVNEARELLAPVTYFAPDTTRNQRALAFDMYSEPVRAAAMNEAKQTVRPTASGRVVLSQEGAGEAPGFVIFMPVYKSVPGSPTLERELDGFVFSSFNAGEFLDAAIERLDPSDFGVRLYDGEASTRNLLVSRSLEGGSSDRFEMPVTIAARDFLLVIEAGNSGVLAPLSMATLVFGLALASMLMLIVRLLAKQATEDAARLLFLEEQQSIRNSLSRELNHRVKNTLANVLSILSLTRRRSSDLDDFADSLAARIQALSATHDLLTDSDWGTTPIRAVIEAEMQHICTASDQGITIEGPEVELAPNDALSFGLAIHELATNAAKFGALSVAGGSVAVRWGLVADNLAEVEWTEQGGPEVPTQRTRGFGTDLIEKIVAHELRHSVRLEFLPKGVRCVIGVPIRQRSEFQMRAQNSG